MSSKITLNFLGYYYANGRSTEAEFINIHRTHLVSSGGANTSGSLYGFGGCQTSGSGLNQAAGFGSISLVAGNRILLWNGLFCIPMVISASVLWMALTSSNSFFIWFWIWRRRQRSIKNFEKKEVLVSLLPSSTCFVRPDQPRRLVTFAPAAALPNRRYRHCHSLRPGPFHGPVACYRSLTWRTLSP